MSSGPQDSNNSPKNKISQAPTASKFGRFSLRKPLNSSSRQSSTNDVLSPSSSKKSSLSLDCTIVSSPLPALFTDHIKNKKKKSSSDEQYQEKLSNATLGKKRRTNDLETASSFSISSPSRKGTNISSDSVINTGKGSDVKAFKFGNNLHSTLPTSAMSPFSSSSAFGKAFSFLRDSDIYEDPQSRQNHSSMIVQGTAQDPTSFIRNAASRPYNLNNIIVSNIQRGNKVLDHIRNVAWEFGEIKPDFILGNNKCALYLQVKYHNLHPTYVHRRIAGLDRDYKLRVLLVYADDANSEKAVQTLSKIATKSGMTLIVAWSLEEAGRYLETFKSYENKGPEMLQGKKADDYLSKLTRSLTSAKSINKTDVITLASTFGSIRNIAAASKSDLAMCPGFGSRKAAQLFDIFRTPFKKK